MGSQGLATRRITWRLPSDATAGTAEALRTLGIECVLVEKTQRPRNSALALIEAGEVDLVINVPSESDELAGLNSWEACPRGPRLRRREELLRLRAEGEW